MYLLGTQLSRDVMQFIRLHSSFSSMWRQMDELFHQTSASLGVHNSSVLLVSSATPFPFALFFLLQIGGLFCPLCVFVFVFLGVFFLFCQFCSRFCKFPFIFFICFPPPYLCRCPSSNFALTTPCEDGKKWLQCQDAPLPFLFHQPHSPSFICSQAIPDRYATLWLNLLRNPNSLSAKIIICMQFQPVMLPCVYSLSLSLILRFLMP